MAKPKPEGPQLELTIPEYRDKLISVVVAYMLEWGKRPDGIRCRPSYYNHIMNQLRLRKEWGFVRTRGKKTHWWNLDVPPTLALKWQGGLIPLRPSRPKKPKKS